MNAPAAAPLYTPGILALAVELAAFPLDADLTLRGEAASRVCGSRIAMGLIVTEDGRIARIGAQVTACAIGQAAAAVFLRHARGKSADELAASLAQMERWLQHSGSDLPNWAGLIQLEPARAFPGRHAAMLLPWQAAMAALSMSPAAG